MERHSPPGSFLNASHERLPVGEPMTGGVFPIQRQPGGTPRSTGSWHRHHHRTHARTLGGSGSDDSSRSSAGPYGLGWIRRSVPDSGLPAVC